MHEIHLTIVVHSEHGQSAVDSGVVPNRCRATMGFGSHRTNAVDPALHNPAIPDVGPDDIWLAHSASFGLQQLQLFGARDEQLAAQRPAGFEFAALDEPVNAEVIHAEHVGGFLNGICQPFGRWRGRMFFDFRIIFHEASYVVDPDSGARPCFSSGAYL